MAQLPVAHAQNILQDIVTSGHVTDVTSGHVTSGHVTSGCSPIAPPQMRLCPSPYITDGQHHCQKKKDNDLQNIHRKLKIVQHTNPTENRDDCLGHSPTTFPNTELCQYERKVCRKRFIFYRNNTLNAHVLNFSSTSTIKTDMNINE
jgi:hypothetical protein